MPRTLMRRQHAILQHGQMRKQVERLEHHADLAPHPVQALGVRPDLHAVEGDASGLVVFELVDAADQRGLAGAGWPAEHDALARATCSVMSCSARKPPKYLSTPSIVTMQSSAEALRSCGDLLLQLLWNNPPLPLREGAAHLPLSWISAIRDSDCATPPPPLLQGGGAVSLPLEHRQFRQRDAQPFAGRSRPARRCS